MRIAFFVDQFPSLSETFILNQITGLIDRGHEVDIFSDKRGNTTQMHPEVLKYNLLERTYYSPIPYYWWWRCLKGLLLVLLNFYKAPRLIFKSLDFRRYNRSRYGDLAKWLSPFYLLLPLLGRSLYDIVHCHYGRNGLKAILLKDLGAINGKIVTTFHGYDISRYLQLHGDDIYNYLFERGDLLQPISQFWYDKLIALGCNPQKIAMQVHHMGIDGDRLTPSKKIQDASAKVMIVSIARLVEKKGLCYGIEAVAKLIQQNPQLELEYQIIGDGILRSSLEQQIEQLGVSQQVQLLGWKQQQEVQTILAQADIVLAPSITSPQGDCEGIPVSLMEAMAQGIPIISTYHSGIPELVDTGVTGYLVPEKAVDLLSEKLAHLIHHPELRTKMGQAGRDKVLQEYNIQLLCDRLVATYQELLN